MDERRERGVVPVRTPGSGSRRVVVQGVAWAGTMVASLAAARQHAGAAQDATPGATPTVRPFASETFVGATSDPNAFLAVVVAADGGSGEREARAYLCNAADLVVWFDRGTMTGDGQLELGAPNGERLVGELTTEAVMGAITLPDGRTLTFEASPATGADGLYTFVLTPDGRVEGRSAGGAAIEGQLQIAGTIRLPDGEAIDYAWPAQLDDTAELRTIYRVDGGRRGAGETRKGSQIKIEP